MKREKWRSQPPTKLQIKYNIRQNQGPVGFKNTLNQSTNRRTVNGFTLLTFLMILSLIYFVRSYEIHQLTINPPSEKIMENIISNSKKQALLYFMDFVCCCISCIRMSHHKWS
uniref:Uncharacterized protein n=1 Tax=Glossina pallidipes TaxID=7398 RepID=A0A1B0A0S5_GLOPL